MEPDTKRLKMSSETEGKILEHPEHGSSSSIQNSQEITNKCQETSPRSTCESGREGDKAKHNSTNSLFESNMISSPVSNSLEDNISSSAFGRSDPLSKNEKKIQLQRAEQKAAMQNGCGQKLESIIGRLSYDKTSTTVTDNDEEALICKADAATQTFPDFVKIVRCLVFRRMKQLEQSLVGGAVTDSVLNGKLVDLQRENRDLRKHARKLQEKLDVILQSLKSDESITSGKIKEVIDNVHSQQITDTVPENTSASRKQSAVVSPYHVQNTQQESQTGADRSREPTGRTRREVIEPSNPDRKEFLAVSTVGNESLLGNSTSSTVHNNPVTRQGPQVKYVPQRFHQIPHLSGPPPSQFIHLAPGSVVMQKMQLQRPHGMEYVSRAQSGQVIYTTQPVQVTGPRMSTIPPQPQQANHHVGQRPIVSPSGMGTRFSQSGQLSRTGGSMLRLQGSNAQTVHYIPQNVMPYMNQAHSTSVPLSGNRIVNQGQSSEMRQHQPAQKHNMLHAEIQPHPSTSLPPPPPYQVQRMQSEPLTAQAKLHLTMNQTARLQNEQSLPPKLQVNITVSGSGIVLSWDFEAEPIVKVAAIECYHLFASQDNPNPPVLKSEWKKIGVVKALPLPMACTLTQFVSGNSYHFAVLAVDVNGREGPMSNPCTVRLNN